MHGCRAVFKDKFRTAHESPSERGARAYTADLYRGSGVGTPSGHPGGRAPGVGLGGEAP